MVVPQGLSASSSNRNRSKSVCEPKLVALREEESLMSAGGSYPPATSFPKGDKETPPVSSSTACGSHSERSTQKGSTPPPPPLPVPSPSCDDDKPSSSFFGVRSYLHHFYDSVALRDADQFEEFEEYRYVQSSKVFTRFSANLFPFD